MRGEQLDIGQPYAPPVGDVPQGSYVPGGRGTVMSAPAKGPMPYLPQDVAANGMPTESDAQKGMLDRARSWEAGRRLRSYARPVYDQKY